MFNFFKGFFGPKNPNETPNEPPNRDSFLRERNEPFFGIERDDDDHMGFNVFSNPLEMHRYFESQVNSMLKNFGLQGDGGFFGLNESGPDMFSHLPDFPEHFQELPTAPPPAKGDLRDQFLKPGYHRGNRNEERSDSDLDGKINKEDLDTIFNKSEPREITPYVPKPKMFGKQIITKMFTNHNGIIESRQTVRDHEGNEEEIVTHKRGTKEYTKRTKTNKNGEKEINEEFVNMNEEDLGKFFGGVNTITDGANDTKMKHPNWFPFDKYFK